MSHKINILEGAYIVSDAHYSQERPGLLNFLKDIHSQKLPATQLILMGDIFDALFGSVPYTIKKNNEAINLINEISLRIEVIYLEGNHDFNLKKVFLNIKIFTISEQPVEAYYNEKKILLAHGDIEGNFGYEIYTILIRNPILLIILGKIDSIFSHFILKKLSVYLGKKDDCKEFIAFEKFISNRLLYKYNCDYFIEGHFHQNKSLKLEHFIYINLGAFACNQRYFVVNSLKEQELLKEKTF